MRKKVKKIEKSIMKSAFNKKLNKLSPADIGSEKVISQIKF